ncbi:MAG: outer membrane beta-barrel protein [Calditrichia bacterium]|jgi:hypothetical protein
MKKAILSLMFLVFFIQPGFSRAPFTEFKIGYFYPEDTDHGYLFGINAGRMIDESLSWSFEINYFQKGYKKITKKEDLYFGGIQPQQAELELEYRTIMLPLYAKLNYEHPIAFKSPIYFRGSAGLGWEMVWNKANNYQVTPSTHETRFYNGFGWQATAGLGFEISSSANFFIDGFYNGSTVKRNSKTNDEGLPTWEELNVSGFGARVGISIVGFGW